MAVPCLAPKWFWAFFSIIISMITLIWIPTSPVPFWLLSQAIHWGISIDSAGPPVDHPSLITFRTLSISLINVTANGVLLETKFSPWNQWRDYVAVSLTFNPKVRCTCPSMNVTTAVCHVFFCAWMLVWMVVDMRIKTSALNAMVILGLIGLRPSLKKIMWTPWQQMIICCHTSMIAVRGDNWTPL